MDFGDSDILSCKVFQNGSYLCLCFFIDFVIVMSFKAISGSLPVLAHHYHWSSVGSL